MRKKLYWIKLFFEFIRCSPHILVFGFHKNKELIKSDIDRWLKVFGLQYSYTTGLVHLLGSFPEFRNLFYKRVGFWKVLLNVICPKLSSLYIYADNIGPGLFIQHGFATIIAAKSIGANCWINQQVTIGYSNDTDMPTLGNGVTINAGAKVIGNVTIGDNSTVGANAVVVKNVPANCTVVGVPASIVKRDGVRVNEKLV